jgi:hypothetical protein
VRPTPALLLALAAFACSDEKPQAKTASLAEAKVVITLADAGPDRPPGTEWLFVPSLAVEIAVPPGVSIEHTAGQRNSWLNRGDFNLHLWKVDPEHSPPDAAAARASLMKEDGFTAFRVDRADGQEWQLEYALETAGKPSYGYSVRRVVGGLPIDCTSHDASAENARIGVQACLSIRLRPADPGSGEEEAQPEADHDGPLPPGRAWLSVPGLGVDVAVPPEVRIGKNAGGVVVLSDGTRHLHLRRAPSGQDLSAIKDRLTKEGGGKLGVMVDRTEGDNQHLEYVIKDRKSGKPVFGLVMRRRLGEDTIECTSRGPETGSTAMAVEACHSMRATPPG